MTVSTLSGPQVTFGITLTSCGVDMEHNPDRGPSVADLGEGLLDPRPPFMFAPGQASSKAFFAWAGLFGGPVVDQVVSARSVNNVAATQVPVGGTALTLTTNTSLGVGATQTILTYSGSQSGNVKPLDSAMGGLAFGVSGGINLWDPTRASARTLGIYGSSNGSSAEAWSVFGYDLYSQPVTELVLGASTGNSSNTGAHSKKAYKYIASIVPSTVNGSIGSTLVTVGLDDTFGFPLRVDHPGYVTCWAGPASSATLVTISTGAHTYGSTSTPTSSTGDVRGTIGTSGVSAAFSSTTVNWKIVMFISPSAQNLQAVSLGSSYPMGLVGQQQFSSN